MSIDGLPESKNFTAQDVGAFLEKAFGPRLSEEGEAWDTEGVEVSFNQETGKVEVRNLDPNQYGPKWIKGVKRSWALTELLFMNGYRPYYSRGRLNAEIPEHEFLAKIEKPREPDFATDGAEEDDLFAEGLSDAIDKALARRDD